MDSTTCTNTNGEYEDGKCYYSSNKRWEWSDRWGCKDLRQKEGNKICLDNSLDRHGIDLNHYGRYADVYSWVAGNYLIYDLKEQKCRCPDFLVLSNDGLSCDCDESKGMKLVVDKKYCSFDESRSRCENSGGTWNNESGCVCDSTMETLWREKYTTIGGENIMMDYGDRFGHGVRGGLAYLYEECFCKSQFNKRIDKKCIYDQSYSWEKNSLGDGSQRSQAFTFTNDSEISFDPNNQCKVNFNSIGDWQFSGGENNSPAYTWVNSADEVEAEANNKERGYKKSRVYNYKYICYPGDQVQLEESNYFKAETESKVEDGKSKQMINLFTNDQNAKDDININVAHKAMCQMFYYSEKEWTDPYGNLITTELKSLPPKERFFNNKITFNMEQIKDCVKSQPETPKQSNVEITFNNPSTPTNYLNQQKFNQLTDLITIASVNKLNEANYNWKNQQPESIDINNQKEINNNGVIYYQLNSNASNNKPTTSGIYRLNAYAKDSNESFKDNYSDYYLDFDPPICGTCTCDQSGSCKLKDPIDNIYLDEQQSQNACQISSGNKCSINIKDIAGNQTICTCQKSKPKLEITPDPNPPTSGTDLEPPAADITTGGYGECDEGVDWCTTTGPAYGYADKCCKDTTLWECALNSSNKTYYEKAIAYNSPECGGSGIQGSTCGVIGQDCYFLDKPNCSMEDKDGNEVSQLKVANEMCALKCEIFHPIDKDTVGYMNNEWGNVDDECSLHQREFPTSVSPKDSGRHFYCNGFCKIDDPSLVARCGAIFSGDCKEGYKADPKTGACCKVK